MVLCGHESSPPKAPAPSDTHLSLTKWVNAKYRAQRKERAMRRVKSRSARGELTVSPTERNQASQWVCGNVGRDGGPGKTFSH